MGQLGALIQRKDIMAEQYHSLEQEISSPRSIDDYLETANQASTTGGRLRHHLVERWRYYIIFLALGIANSGDSAEMGCMNFLLSSEGFQKDVSTFANHLFNHMMDHTYWFYLS